MNGTSVGSGRGRTCSGTCHRLRDRPSTIPMGKRTPQTAAWRKMWIQRIVSTAAWAASSESSSSCPCAHAVLNAKSVRMSRRWVCRPMLIIRRRNSDRDSDDSRTRVALLGPPRPIQSSTLPRWQSIERSWLAGLHDTEK